MRQRWIVLRGIVWVICAYHLAAGLAFNCPPAWVYWVAEHFFKVTHMPDASAIFIVRMMGAYMMAFGVAMGLVAWNPEKNRAFLTVGVILTVIRCIQRLLTAGQLEQVLGISRSYNWLTIAIMGFFTLALAAFRWRLYRDMKMDSLR